MFSLNPNSCRRAVVNPDLAPQLGEVKVGVDMFSTASCIWSLCRELCWAWQIHADLWIGLMPCKSFYLQSQLSDCAQVLANYLGHFIFNIMDHLHLSPYIPSLISLKEFQICISVSCSLYSTCCLPVSYCFPLVYLSIQDIVIPQRTGCRELVQGQGMCGL